MSALHKLSRRDETLSSKLDENSVNYFTLSIIRKIIDLQENIKYAQKLKKIFIQGMKWGFFQV